jgi:hypothetical protein
LLGAVPEKRKRGQVREKEKKRHAACTGIELKKRAMVDQQVRRGFAAGGPVERQRSIPLSYREI